MLKKVKYTILLLRYDMFFLKKNYFAKVFDKTTLKNNLSVCSTYKGP